MAETAAVVSSDDETLILVDSDDREIGHLSKGACHDGAGRLHRAFSVFLFNAAGELLLQQRSAGKRLWPLVWSNSCCSHPRRGEDVLDAARRRVAEELGIDCEVEFLYKFEYNAAFGDAGAEHELCWVLAGQHDGDPQPNPNELAAWRWLTPAGLNAELNDDPDGFTPWLRLEWRRLRADFPGWGGGDRL